MTTSRQAMCHARGHAWMPWGLWRATLPPMPAAFTPLPQPVDLEITKIRYRQCERCGAEQSQDGGGAITALDAPEKDEQ